MSSADWSRDRIVLLTKNELLEFDRRRMGRPNGAILFRFLCLVAFVVFFPQYGAYVAFTPEAAANALTAFASQVEKSGKDGFLLGLCPPNNGVGRAFRFNETACPIAPTLVPGCEPVSDFRLPPRDA